MLLVAFSARAQKDKFGMDTLKNKLDYLFNDSTTEGFVYKPYKWNGERIGVQGEFDIYRLPSDHMICLVPNQRNPSTISTVKISLTEGPGKIPNPLGEPGKSLYTRRKPGQ
jgi:hypothetical protein